MEIEKKLKKHTLIKSAIIPFIIITITTALFLLALPIMENALPNAEAYSQVLQEEVSENE